MAKPEGLLARLLNTPDLAKAVPRLEPEVLHRVIQNCGLEDCAEFVAFATPAQLARVLDLDVWRVRAPGMADEFDPERFGQWLTVLIQAGAGIAAEKLEGLDIALVSAGLARHAAVFDCAAVSSYTTLDGEHVPGPTTDRTLTAEIGGYVIHARRMSAWDAIVELLAALEDGHQAYFHRLMRRCIPLSNGVREADGFHDLLDDDAQHMFDLARDREARREQQGYLAPSDARAFLLGARDLGLDGRRPPLSAIVRATFDAIPTPTSADGSAVHNDASPEADVGVDPPRQPDGAGAIEDVLREEGLLIPPPRGLLGAPGGQASRLALIRAHVASGPRSDEELAFLANALVAGCSVQGRPFTPREASDGAAAICNLGLQNWPSGWADPDLVTAFQVGWTVLHRDVCLYAARGLIAALDEIRCLDRDIQLRLDGLRRDLAHHVRGGEPWRARPALDAIMMLDAPSWAALLSLIDECPVIHAAVRATRQRLRTIDPAAFEFISDNNAMAAVREFIASLPAALSG